MDIPRGTLILYALASMKSSKDICSLYMLSVHRITFIYIFVGSYGSNVDSLVALSSRASVFMG